MSVIPAQISAGYKYGSIRVEGKDSSNKNAVCNKVGFSGQHCLSYGGAGVTAADKNIISVAHQTGSDGGDIPFVRTEIQDFIFIMERGRKIESVFSEVIIAPP